MSMHQSSAQSQGEHQHDRVPGHEGGIEGRSGAPAWCISVSMHAAVALLFWAVIFARSEPIESEKQPIQITMLPPKPPTPPLTPEVKPHAETLQLALEVADEQKPVELATPTDSTIDSESTDVSDATQGRSDALAAVETGSAGAFMTIGAGGGGSGMLGNRIGASKQRAMHVIACGFQTEGAVRCALIWFQKHQSQNGMWDVEKYPSNCLEMPKCEPGSVAASGGSDASVATTAFSLLCFLGAGYDHRTPSVFSKTVRKGVAYLLSVQKTDGSFGNRNYEHAVAAMALAEAYAMTGDADLKIPAQKSISVILARQAHDPQSTDSHAAGLGWDYVEGNPARIDSSVSGWNVMALKSALAGGLNVGQGLAGAKTWLERAWKATNKDWSPGDPYTSTSQFPYVWDATNDKVQIDPPGSANHDLASVGALCAVFLGHHAGDVMFDSLCNHIVQYELPTSYPCNTYYLYYNTLAMFQAGGQRWNRWNATVPSLLVNAQHQENGCMRGSWDWEGTKFHGNDHGRILSTAYCCLSLEVYYRYKRVTGNEPASLK